MNRVIYGIEGKEGCVVDSSSTPEKPSLESLVMDKEPPIEMLYYSDVAMMGVIKSYIAVSNGDGSGKWEYSKEITTDKVKALRNKLISIQAKPLKENAELEALLDSGDESNADLSAYKKKVKEIIEEYPLPD